MTSSEGAARKNVTGGTVPSQEAFAIHHPVLCTEVVELFASCRGGWIVDGTVGLGGHAAALLRADPERRILGIDRDQQALECARQRLAEYQERIHLVHGNYADAPRIVAAYDVEAVQGLLLDLGASSLQFDDPSRGFSLRSDGLLDMRMDSSQGLTAADWLSSASEREIVEALFQFGEERYARRIARAIVRERANAPLRRTSELVRIIHCAVPARYFAERIDPATRTFQAVRIAVNNELAALELGLTGGFGVLAPGGVFAVISFHSLEDRAVKHFFRERAAHCVCPPDLPECLCGKRVEAEILTRRPILPSEAEVHANPRSRSGKLRACRKVA